MASRARSNATRELMIEALNAGLERLGEDDFRSDTKGIMFFVLGYMSRGEPEIAATLEKLLNAIKD